MIEYLLELLENIGNNSINSHSKCSVDQSLPPFYSSLGHKFIKWIYLLFWVNNHL